MNFSLDAILQAIGGIVTVSALATAIAALIGVFFKKAVEKWIDNHFEQRKKEFEHEQAKELQQLKVKIDTILQGSLKFQEREFTVIPEAFAKTCAAFNAAQSVCYPAWPPPLEKMNAEELIEALAKTSLTEYQKKVICLASGTMRADRWQEFMTYQHMNSFREIYRDAYHYVDIHGIFIPDEIRGELSVLLFQSQKYASHYQLAISKNPVDAEMANWAQNSLLNDTTKLVPKLHNLVRNRLLEKTKLSEEQQTA